MTPAVTAVVYRSSEDLKSMYVVQCLKPWAGSYVVTPVPSVQLHQWRDGLFVYSGAYKRMSNQVMLYLEANIDHSPGNMHVEDLILQHAYLTKYTW